MIDSIPDEEKGKRLQVLLDRQREIQRVNYSKQIGEVIEVMVEGANPARGQIAGRSSQNKPVNFTCAQPIAPAPGSYLQRARSRGRFPTAWSAKPSNRQIGNGSIRKRAERMDGH